MTIKNKSPLFRDGDITSENLESYLIETLEMTVREKQACYLKVVTKFAKDGGTDKELLSLVFSAFIELEGYKLAITASKDVFKYWGSAK